MNGMSFGNINMYYPLQSELSQMKSRNEQNEKFVEVREAVAAFCLNIRLQPWTAGSKLSCCL
jgi:hypothetical protein